MNDFKPSETESADFARRVYNGIKSRHIACLVEKAVTHAMQDPSFRAKLTPLDVNNLKVVYED